MDIAGIKSKDRVIEMVEPGSGDPLGISVTLMSLQDDRLKTVKRRISDEKIKLEQRGKTFKSDEIEENSNLLVFSAMVGWEWRDDACFHSEKPEFNKKNVIQVFTELPWFRSQLDAELGDTTAFFK